MLFDDLKKAVDKGMEYAFMTKDKVEKAVKDFAQENNLNKEEAKKLLDQLVKKSEETWKNVEEKMQEIQKNTIEKMNLVTKEDYKKLEDRLKKLEASQKTSLKPKKKGITKKLVDKSNKKG